MEETKEIEAHLWAWYSFDNRGGKARKAQGCSVCLRLKPKYTPPIFFFSSQAAQKHQELKLSKAMIQGCGWWMSMSALIAEGHVHRPPVCIRHLAPSEGAPSERRDTATLPSASLMNATSRFHFSMRWAGGTSSIGLGRRQFSLTCPAAAALKCFLGLVWKQDSVLGLRRRRFWWRQLFYWCKDQTKEVWVDGATDHKLWTHLKYRWS